MKRVLSLLTALALCAALAAPAFAETPAEAPLEAGTEPQAVETIPENDAAPQPVQAPPASGTEPQAAETYGAEPPAAQPTEEPPATPTVTPTADPTWSVHAASDAYIISASAVSVVDGELTSIKKGDTFNVVVVVADRATDESLLANLKSLADVNNPKVAEDYISSRITSSSFSHTGTAEVGPYSYAGVADGASPEQYYENFLDRGAGYYKYKLLFRNVTWLGGDNTFSFDVSYPDSLLAYKSLSFTIGQCVTAEDSDETGDKDQTPHLMVRSSSYGNTAINAGQPFTLAVTVYATKGNENLDDVTVTLDLRSEGITLQSGTLSQYIGTMRANTTQDVYFTILPSISFTGGVADIGVSLQGFGSKTGTESSGSVAISVPIEQPDRFEVTSVEMEPTLYVGEGGRITVNFVNKGRNPVSNLEASISGQNLGADITQQYIGNLAAGTENGIDFDLMPPEPGPVVGVVTLTYEAADGSAKTVTEEFSAEAMESPYNNDMFDDGMMPEPEPEKTGLPLWGWLLIGGAVIGGGTAGVVLVRKRRKEKAMATLEADDEDF